VNTPLEGIDLVLKSVFERAEREAIPTLAMPLLGTGYANVRRQLDPTLLNAAVLGLTIVKAGETLGKRGSSLRRIIVAAFSKDPQGAAEHALWEFVVQLLAVPPGKRAEWFQKWYKSRRW
jgi:hypothetical protein